MLTELLQILSVSLIVGGHSSVDGDRMFEKIATGYGADAPDELHAAVTDNGRVWIVSKKGVDQKKYSYYHRTCLTGGFATYFDVNTKQWSPRVEFGVIDADENREEVVFAHGNDLYVLIYQRFDGISMRELRKWTGTSWDKVDLKLDPSAQFSEAESKGQGEVAFCETPTGLYLVLTATGMVKLIQLVMPAAEVRFVMDIPQEQIPYRSWGHIVGIGVSGDHAVMYGGSHGCGFRWENDRLTLVNLANKTATLQVAPDEEDWKLRPQWSFSGPSSKVVLANGRWVMMSGSIQCGECDSERSDAVWWLDLSAPTWTQDATTMPKELHEYAHVVAGDRKNAVYALDANAVYKATF